MPHLYIQDQNTREHILHYQAQVGIKGQAIEKIGEAVNSTGGQEKLTQQIIARLILCVKYLGSIRNYNTGQSEDEYRLASCNRIA